MKIKIIVTKFCEIKKNKQIKKYSQKLKNNVDKGDFLYYIISVDAIGCNSEYGGIAQLARAIGSYPAGHRFKSYCRYHNMAPSSSG